MGQRDDGTATDTEPASEARYGKPAMEVCSSAPDRTKYVGCWCDLISQVECELKVLLGWEPQARSLARTYCRSRTFYFEVADVCGL